MNCRKGWRPSEIAQITQSRSIEAVTYDNSFLLKFNCSMHLNTDQLLPIDENIYENLFQPASKRSGLSDGEAEDTKSQEHPRIHDRSGYAHHGRFQRNLFGVYVGRAIGIKMLRRDGLPIALVSKITAIAVNKPAGTAIEHLKHATCADADVCHIRFALKPAESRLPEPYEVGCRRFLRRRDSLLGWRSTCRSRSRRGAPASLRPTAR